MKTVKKNVRHLTLNQEIKIMKDFTDTFKKLSNSHISIRESECLKIQFPSIMCNVLEGDLFVGRMEYLPIGFSSQSNGIEMCYCADIPLLEEMIKDEISQENKEILKELVTFWKENKTHARVRNAYPEKLKKALPSDEFTTDIGIAFPLYRLSGSLLDYGKLLELGIPGLKSLIDMHIEKDEKLGKDIYLYKSMKIVLDIFIDVCLYYDKNCQELAENTKNPIWHDELLEMSMVLKNIAYCKPKTFREAIQMVFLYWQLSSSLNFGRMDTYLGDFYVNDISKGIISKEEALHLLENMWRILAAKDKMFDTRIVIGGMGRSNEKNADEFALLAMEATRNVKEVVPQLTLRFYDGMNSKLMEKALDVLAEGRTFPMLYNDDLNIKSVMKAFDIDFEEAINYCPFGCGEYVIHNKSFGTPSGLINLVEALLATMNNGKDPVRGNLIGLETGNFEDFNDFDEFYNAFYTQVKFYVEALADQEELEYKIAGQECSCLYFSILFDDCIKRGKALFSGGIRYLGGTLEAYGNTNTADSLTAIKELIYDKKLLTTKQMLDALKSNFEGYEKEHRLMLESPKYGNDDEFADQMAIKLHDDVCNTIRNQRERTGLHNYMAVIINNSINTGLGVLTGASPDGREAFKYLANANNPQGGMDKSGITAMLNSLVKLDTSIHAGSVQNMKFSKELFEKNRDKLELLLDGYFNSGGSQAMITVLDKGDLEDAMKYPEKYGNLIVRVGGFSARFVELSRNVQLEILSRTLY